MKIIRTIEALRTEILAAKGAGKNVSLVPTMGYLHAGHAALITAAASETDFVCVSIFVNRLQFNSAKDFETYPVSESEDIEVCKKAGASLVFMPSHDEMYSLAPALQLSMPSLSANLCGPVRPNHFEGVLLIVARLFNLFQPDVAFFGKKDYQQYRIIERLVRDLNFPVRIVGCETVREPDGLAMSSRNANLRPEHREQAALIYRSFKILEKAVNNGMADPIELTEIAQDVIVSGPDNRIDYVQIVHPETLELLQAIDGPFVVAAAVFCGEVRLIDNMTISPVVHDSF
ncbi:MAG: pantoate--beta-alanine ligase [Leptospirales bacterium]|nr:pantoate--beta-alanine ligase [Leptospirales bacterium]